MTSFGTIKSLDPSSPRPFRRFCVASKRLRYSDGDGPLLRDRGISQELRLRVPIKS